MKSKTNNLLSLSLILLASGCSMLGLGKSSAKKSASSNTSSERASSGDAASDQTNSGDGRAETTTGASTTENETSNHEESANQQSEVKALPMVADDGFINDLHRERPKTIQFSTKMIERKDPKVDELQNSFSLGDAIFIRVFLDGSFDNSFRKAGVSCLTSSSQPRRMLNVYLNDADKPVYLETRNMHKDDWATWTAYMTAGKGALNRKPTFYPGGDHEDDQVSYNFWSRLVPQLKEGSNSLRFESVGECYGKKTSGGYDTVRLPLAEGKITVSATAQSLRKAVKQHTPKLPVSKQPASVVKEMKKTMEKEWANERILKIVAPNKWSVKLHPIHGRPIRRFTDAWVITRAEGKDTCRIWNNSFTQQANGSSYHKAMSLGVGSENDFPCP